MHEISMIHEKVTVEIMNVFPLKSSHRQGIIDT